MFVSYPHCIRAVHVISVCHLCQIRLHPCCICVTTVLYPWVLSVSCPAVNLAVIWVVSAMDNKNLVVYVSDPCMCKRTIISWESYSTNVLLLNPMCNTPKERLQRALVLCTKQESISKKVPWKHCIMLLYIHISPIVFPSGQRFFQLSFWASDCTTKMCNKDNMWSTEILPYLPIYSNYLNFFLSETFIYTLPHSSVTNTTNNPSRRFFLVSSP